MDIAMVNPALIDARLDRIHRLVDGINAFKEQFNRVWADLAPAGMERPQFETANVQTPIQPDPVRTAPTPLNTAPITSASNTSKVTADDIDIDAMLSDIDLTGDFSL